MKLSLCERSWNQEIVARHTLDAEGGLTVRFDRESAQQGEQANGQNRRRDQHLDERQTLMIPRSSHRGSLCSDIPQPQGSPQSLRKCCCLTLLVSRPHIGGDGKCLRPSPARGRLGRQGDRDAPDVGPLLAGPIGCPARFEAGVDGKEDDQEYTDGDQNLDQVKPPVPAEN